jgi:hypothetical protein
MFHDRQSDAKVRTFVLISDVPRTLGTKDLRQALMDQTTGLMKLLLLDSEDAYEPSATGGDTSAAPVIRNDGYALALYDSRVSAVEACDAGVLVPDQGKEAKITMRAVRTQEVHTLEATYRDSIEIEGESVKKAELAPTKGLQMVLSSTVGVDLAAGEERRFVTPRWCDASRKNLDCPRGTKCRFIHKLGCQFTGRPQAVPAFTDATAADATVGSKRGAAELPPPTSGVHVSEAHAVAPLHSTVPLVYRPVVEHVPLNRLQLLALADKHDEAPDEVDLDAIASALGTSIDSAIASVANKTGEITVHNAKFFVRLDAPHGTPLDAPFVDEGYSADLRQECPKPQAFNTPVDRDVYLQRLLCKAREACAISSGAAAFNLLRASQRVRGAVESALDRARQAGIAPTDNTTALARLAVMPFYDPTPVPYATAQVYFRDGGVYACLQADADILAHCARAGDQDDLDAVREGRKNATQSKQLIESIERRATLWVHRFATVTKLHLAMAGRADASLCVTVALPHLRRCVDAWTAEGGGRDVEDAAFSSAPVVALSVAPLADKAAGNTLFPATKPAKEGEVRWRTMNSVYTQHLQRELRLWLG